MLLAVIAYLTPDTTLKVVEGHLKGLKVQFQHIIEIGRQKQSDSS
jgi:hypothetical protein